ncbi:DUF3955 domain-containing protein [Psychrobacillus vulpis]|uniref:DUF3955 domain-containing protein n=1 Tax=Psychrobacillus vulpis TaxID=2325572 RepID=A0A544TUA7_9BACI|nr:DUF3955 domain-containing protein [Psychrobacillus vulpis]TQR21027.1 DUF3955 domain-containing protein [Psychrobacillus vulpis]
MKKHILAFTSLILGLICFVTFNIIGGKVEADGTLTEPFFLLPIGYIFIFSGIILLISIIFKRSKRSLNLN